MNEFCVGSCSDETVVRRVRNKLNRKTSCAEDHIEISGVVNPELSFLVTKILKIFTKTLLDAFLPLEKKKLLKRQKHKEIHLANFQ